MSLRIMPITALPDWINHLRAEHHVVGPRPLHGQHVFGEITAADEINLSYATSVLPPKKYLLPQKETLFRFTQGGAQVEAVFPEDQPTVILGIHTCDLHAIELLDEVFAQGYPDQHYQRRREQTLLVGIECLKPCMEHSFCKSMGTLGITSGFDLHLVQVENDYAIDVGTERGQRLLDRFEPAREAKETDYRRVNQVLSDKWSRFSYRLDFDITELPSLLSVSYRSHLWEELGERCLACGMCTSVCPTCYCFNVEDETALTLQTGQRSRIWDSCQLDRFAAVAGGHNFRPTRAARQRHRFMRKGKYQLDAYGMVGCVGCGRCAQACPVHITPVDTFNELYRRRASMSRRQEAQT